MRRPEKRRLAQRLRPEPEPDRIRFIWDVDLVGFGLRVMPSGIRTFILQCRTLAGRSVTITLGRADQVTAEQARRIAAEHLQTIQQDRDPAAELQAQRKQTSVQERKASAP